MQDYIDAFLGGSAYAETTKANYRYALLRLDEWLKGRGLTIDGLTGPLYTEWINSYGWGNNSRRNYAYAVRAFVVWMGYGKHHPVYSVAPARDNSAPGRSLDAADLQTLLKSFDLNTAIGWRNLAIVALMAETGLRSSEVCHLEVGKLDLRRRQFMVLVKRSRWQNKIISVETARILDVWLEHREKHAAPGVKTVFISLGGLTRGNPMTRDGLKGEFSKFGKRSGIGHISPHDMRRTMAVLMTEAGAPTRLVQVLGGWDSIKMVERYTRNLKPQQIDKYSPVGRLFGQSPEAEGAPVSA
jgi:site-specific recombinase XerD